METTFDEKVFKFKNSLSGTIVYEEYIRINKDQNVCFFIEKNWIYHVHALFESDNKLDLCLTTTFADTLFLKNDKVKLDNFKSLLEKEDISNRNDIAQLGDFFCDYKLKGIPDLHHSPDKYLNHGDHIFIHRRNIYYHHAIYVGDGKVVHMSKNGQRNKLESAVYEHNWETFLDKTPGTISVRVYVFKEDRERLVKLSKSLAEKRFLSGRYDVIKQNCESFSHFVWTGRNFSAQTRYVFRKFNVLRFFLGASHFIRFKIF
jgi:hypothetical protein